MKLHTKGRYVVNEDGAHIAHCTNHANAALIADAVNRIPEDEQDAILTNAWGAVPLEELALGKRSKRSLRRLLAPFGAAAMLLAAIAPSHATHNDGASSVGSGAESRSEPDYGGMTRSGSPTEILTRGSIGDPPREDMGWLGRLGEAISRALGAMFGMEAPDDDIAGTRG
jgi:hypothetical protein